MNTLIETIGWFGSICIFAGLYGVTHNRRGAFLFSVVGECAWIIKSLYLHAWDLFSMTMVFAALALYGYHKWGVAEREEELQKAMRFQQAQAAQEERAAEMQLAFAEGRKALDELRAAGKVVDVPAFQFPKGADGAGN